MPIFPRSFTSPQTPTTSGFTLIELLVVIAITGMVALISVSSFRDERARTTLQTGAFTVSDALQRAQNYALSGALKNENKDTTGYGVHIDELSRTIILFQDIGPNQNYAYDAGGVESLSEISLDFDNTQQISKPKLSINVDAPDVVRKLDIVFQKGTGRVYVNYKPLDELINSAQITLSHRFLPEVNRTVTIDRMTGRIDVSQY